MTEPSKSPAPTKVPPAPPAVASGEAGVTPPPEPAPAALTPEEQMALFERDLIENDTGHRPC
jgi:hypothetical protein